MDGPATSLEFQLRFRLGFLRRSFSRGSKSLQAFSAHLRSKSVFLSEVLRTIGSLPNKDVTGIRMKPHRRKLHSTLNPKPTQELNRQADDSQSRSGAAAAAAAVVSS